MPLLPRHPAASEEPGVVLSPRTYGDFLAERVITDTKAIKAREEYQRLLRQAPAKEISKFNRYEDTYFLKEFRPTMEAMEAYAEASYAGVIAQIGQENWEDFLVDLRDAAYLDWLIPRMKDFFRIQRRIVLR